MSHKGGCLCGGLRYEATAGPLDAGYCHCRMCQILSGSTVLPWVSFERSGFSYVKGSPRIYRSSSHGQREFCSTCGSQIAFRSTDRPTTVEINTGTLDDPETMPPGYHIWYESRISWFDIADDLPRHAGNGPDT